MKKNAKPGQHLSLDDVERIIQEFRKFSQGTANAKKRWKGILQTLDALQQQQLHEALQERNMA